MNEESVITQVHASRTSREWWNQVKNDPERFIDWLRKQYHGEILAAERVRSFQEEHAPAGHKWHKTLDTIAGQEATHAGWVGELLRVRGVTPAKLDKPERYWDKALAGAEGFTAIAATAAHAETMRLQRITVIVEDDTAPEDVRAVFAQILPQEQFHAKAFTAMAGDAAMQAALARHEEGMAAINVQMEGLIPADF